MEAVTAVIVFGNVGTIAFNALSEGITRFPLAVSKL